MERVCEKAMAIGVDQRHVRPDQARAGRMRAMVAAAYQEMKICKLFEWQAAALASPGVLDGLARATLGHLAATS